MRAFFMALTIALLCHVSPANAASLTKRISMVEKQFEQMREARAGIRAVGGGKWQDVQRWAYTPALDKRVRELLAQARDEDDARALAALSEAEALLGDASLRALEIAGFWDDSQVVRWRERWRNFAAANGRGTEPDAALLALESTMFEQRDRGDFIAARSTGQQLKQEVNARIRAIQAEVAKAVDSATLNFVARSNPCETEPGAEARPNARITRAADPDRFYPPASKRREEQGDIVIRARVAASGCATAFALVSSSGFPDLDQAALKVAELSRYAPATENATPVDGYVTFKVRFVLAR